MPCVLPTADNLAVGQGSALHAHVLGRTSHLGCSTVITVFSLTLVMTILVCLFLANNLFLIGRIRALNFEVFSVYVVNAHRIPELQKMSGTPKGRESNVVQTSGPILPQYFCLTRVTNNITYAIIGFSLINSYLNSLILKGSIVSLI